ncbi:hypothetical protein KJ742_03655 [Patescibacteria group bacterium]|nr:hypothetical protein [Patescibacteria group bacterium]MBU1683017.1 hypothetical protein [Patescibacteria group bacterium]MBU1935245.1 hypothetical protein [Patescibacteria group bacterium]
MTEKKDIQTSNKFVIKDKSGEVVFQYRMTNKNLGGKIYCVSKNISAAMPQKETTFVERSAIKHFSKRLKTLFETGE